MMSLIPQFFGKMLRRGPSRLANFEVSFPGWEEVERKRDFVVWRNQAGDVLSLAAIDEPGAWSNASDTDAVRNLARAHAEECGAGLVEASIVSPSDPRIVSFIYKKLVGTGFRFNGIQIVISKPFSWIWTVVDQEKGTTGVREAVVTDRMIGEGSLTLESYESDWARDPYYPDYVGVDRRNLRYISDDPKYDGQFPHHPLAMIRRRFGDLKDIRVNVSL